MVGNVYINEWRRVYRSLNAAKLVFHGESSKLLGFLLWHVRSNCSDVAHQTFVFGAFHGRTFEEGAVLFETEVAPIVPGHGEESF